MPPAIRCTTPSLLHVGADLLSCFRADSEVVGELKVELEAGEQEGPWYDPYACCVSGNRCYVRKEKTWEALQVVPGPDGQTVTIKRLWSIDSRPAGPSLVAQDRLCTIAPGNDTRLFSARDAASGALVWEGKVDKTQLSGGVAVDGKLVLTTATGQLVLIQTAKSTMRLLAQATIKGRDACWSPPALSAGQLFLRDCSGAVRCFDLKTP
jgi:hypothetical protein